MEKTVNQWIDFIDQADHKLKDHPEVIRFKHFLIRLKHDEQYLQYGGMVKGTLPPVLESLIKGN